jgi:hypothetical protein
MKDITLPKQLHDYWPVKGWRPVQSLPKTEAETGQFVVQLYYKEKGENEHSLSLFQAYASFQYIQKNSYHR